MIAFPEDKKTITNRKFIKVITILFFRKLVFVTSKSETLLTVLNKTFLEVFLIYNTENLPAFSSW